MSENCCKWCGKPFKPFSLKTAFFEKEVYVPDCDCAQLDLDYREGRQREAIRKLCHLDARCCFEADDGKNPDAAEKAQRYVNHFTDILNSGRRAGLFLFGGIGTGKSFLAYCIGNALFDKGFSVEFANLDGLVTESTVNFGEHREKVMERLASRDLFILDDFGVERGTEYMNEKVFSLIDARYQSGKPTIVTSNFAPAELKNQQDFSKQRVFSRILEMCGGFIELKGEDRRRDISRENAGWLRELLNDEAGGDT